MGKRKKSTIKQAATPTRRLLDDYLVIALKIA